MVQDTEFYSSKELSVVFFQKNYKELLPQATCGDILILRKVKVRREYLRGIRMVSQVTYLKTPRFKTRTVILV